MDYDALTANVAPGGLNNRTEIRILLCCLLADADAPVPIEPLKQALHFGGLVNYFEASYAFDDLVKSGNIAPVDGSGGNFEITDSGREIAETLRSGLPATVVEKSGEILRGVLQRHRNERETEVTFDRVGDGCRVNCAIKEGEYEIMCVSLLMPDRISANRVRDAFLEDPGSIYTVLLEKLGKINFNRGEK